jgi:hypothetical protein
MSQASWAKDLLNYIDSVVYGEAQIQPIVVKREHKKTIVIETKAIETLKYDDNDQALKQLLAFILNLANEGFSGSTSLHLTMLDGKLEVIAYETLKQTPYKPYVRNK